MQAIGPIEWDDLNNERTDKSKNYIPLNYRMWGIKRSIVL
jgi:hypothetical protein